MKVALGVLAILAGMLMLMYSAVYIVFGWAMLSGGLFNGDPWGLVLCILTIVGGAALCYAGWSAIKHG